MEPTCRPTSAVTMWSPASRDRSLAPAIAKKAAVPAAMSVRNAGKRANRRPPNRRECIRHSSRSISSNR
jgi:hypothetical protein